MTDLRDSISNRRLFHAMVLMGGSLALGCGGVTRESHEGDGSGGSAGAGGPGGNAGAGGQVGSAGALTIGGANGIAGTSNGGSSAGTLSPVQPACEPPQWDCTSSPPYCAGNFYVLPSGCTCEEARPLEPADCGDGESFVCLAADAGPDGAPIERVAFSCACLPSESYCELSCDTVSEPGATCIEETSGDATSVLCGCAVIVLR